MAAARPRKWILVVDDEAPFRALCIEVLEGAGYAVVGCQDGLEAAELVRDLLPDLVLLDLRMPRTSGWDFLETMRASPTGSQIPVVIVSAYLEEEPEVPAPAGLNVVGRLPKPVGLAELVAKVQEVIGPGTPPGG